MSPNRISEVTIHNTEPGAVATGFSLPWILEFVRHAAVYIATWTRSLPLILVDW